MKTLASCAAGAALVLLAGYASADARSDYYQRAAESDTAAFQALDINHDGVVEQSEAAGDVDFGARFSDMDRNGDRVVTEPELAVYVGDRYGVQIASAAKATMVTRHIAEAEPAKRG